MRKRKGCQVAKNYAYPVVVEFSPQCHGSHMDNLARIREARGLTQTQLAEAIGANQATISKIEKGVGNPTLDMIQRLAGALHVHPSELFIRDALEQRAIDALHRLRDDGAREAALTVLEAMAQGAARRD
jgi:transcriptional regulator with XRE-family HTH domain